MMRWRDARGALRHECRGSSQVAMLTGVVNIAVFAAFGWCARRTIGSNAAFKRVCREWQLDVSRYGRQKRQETARSGKVGGKSGTVWRGCRRIHVNNHVIARGCGWLCLARYAVVKVREPWGGSMLMELIYHRLRWLSRVAGEDGREGGQALAGAAMNGRRTGGWA